MLALSHEAAADLRPVADLLTRYLLSSAAFRWPGADGMLLEDVLIGYRLLAAGGHVPAEAELCERHPELATRLTAFFVLVHEVPLAEG